MTLDDTLIEGNVDGENADTYHKVDYEADTEKQKAKQTWRLRKKIFRKK